MFKENSLLFAMFVGIGLLLNGPKEIHAQELTDTQISDQIEDEFLFDQGVDSLQIDVSTADGIATLTGSVNNLLAKERSTRLAETVKGVRSVINQIEVRPVSTRSDAEISNDIESALAEDPATESYEVDNTVKNGVVTLTGEVDSFKEKELSGLVAKGVRGVTDLKNNIDVNYETERSDSEIAAEIRKGIDWSPYIDNPESIEIEVSNEVVTLSGLVGSAAEKRFARSLAWVGGVNDVKSNDLGVSVLINDPQVREKKYPGRTQKQIRDAVTDALFQDPRVNSFNIEVDVAGSMVTLRGKVSSLRAKRSAEQTTRNTLGVMYVTNRIKVRPDGLDLTDTEIDSLVESALQRNPYLEEYEILSVVVNGVVNLSGTVDSYFEKSQAEEVASTVTGVTHVDNNLVVDTTLDAFVYDPYTDSYNPYRYDWYDFEQPVSFDSDNEIAEEIKDELWWSPFVDSDEIAVSVDGHKATLTGTVDSWAEKAVATENAIEGGAISVVNNLTVE